ncbi:hypothetical protein V8F33_013735 [Rhypophila sp. PSN 637]
MTSISQTSATLANSSYSVHQHIPSNNHVPHAEPGTTVGLSIKARGVLASAAFHDYHTKDQFNQGSVYIRPWTEYFVSQGIPVGNIAKFHIGGFFSLIANTTPTAF